MNVKSFFSKLIELVMIFSLGFGLVYVVIKVNETAKQDPMSHERILYVKDSLEMEYYRNLLEEGFPEDHSEIPDSTK